jgi:hypothetical protein
MEIYLKVLISEEMLSNKKTTKNLVFKTTSKRFERIHNFPYETADLNSIKLTAYGKLAAEDPNRANCLVRSRNQDQMQTKNGPQKASEAPCYMESTISMKCESKYAYFGPGIGLLLLIYSACDAA